LILAYAAVAVFAHFQDDAYVAALLPWLGWNAAWLVPGGFSVGALDLVRTDRDSWIVLQAATHASLTLGSTTLPPATTIRVSILHSVPLQHLAMSVCLLALWPADSWRRRTTLLMLALPAALIATTLDVPLALGGLVQQLLLDHGVTETGMARTLAFYPAFLDDGGRLGLALSVAALVALATSDGARSPQKP
jgi:hypothetical protein